MADSEDTPTAPDNLDHVDFALYKLAGAGAVLDALIDQYADLKNGPTLLNKELGTLIGVVDDLVQHARAAIQKIKT